MNFLIKSFFYLFIVLLLFIFIQNNKDTVHINCFGIATYSIPLFLLILSLLFLGFIAGITVAIKKIITLKLQIKKSNK